MKYLVILSTLFTSGSIIGWIIELFYRRFFTQKKWVNPGFLYGPYLPIYGFGVILLYGISNIPIDVNNDVVNILIKILIIGFGMTLIEFIAGLIFIKKLHFKLWDYSNKKGNILGIICPQYSIFWLIVGSLYYFFLNNLFVNAITWISENLIYTYFIGVVIGMMIVDTAYSIHLASKLKTLKENYNGRFEELKIEFKKKLYSFKGKEEKPNNTHP